MSPIKWVAAAVSLVDGAWGVLVAVSWRSFFGVPPWQSQSSVPSTASGLDIAMLVVGVLLIMDSAVCFLGISPAYYASALLAVIMLVFVPGGIQAADLFVVSAVLGAATVALDAVAANTREYLPEQDHPLNLPVFG